MHAISGALFRLRIQYEYTQTECDEGARDGIDIWYKGIIKPLRFYELLKTFKRFGLVTLGFAALIGYGARTVV